MSVKAAAGVDEDLHELLGLMGRVLPALKRGGPPPAALVEAAARMKGCEGGCDLGPRHGTLLAFVALERDLSVSELAACVGLSVSTVSLMVGELSRAGLVERSEDERDRRRTLVRLHPDYAAELEAWTHQRLAPLQRALARLAPDARAHFIDGWRLLGEEVGAASGGDAAQDACPST